MTVFRVSIYCPYCHRYSFLTMATRNVSVSTHRGFEEREIDCIWTKNQNEKWWIGICNNCKNPVLVLNKGMRIFPYPLPAPSDQRIPEIIRQDLDESKLCYSVKAYRARAVMARRALQSACIEKGTTEKNLSNQIKELADKGIITKELKEWADAVRFVGNDAAHPGGEEVKKDDAEDILNLTEQFLHVIYIAPAIAKEQQKKRKK